MEWCSKKTQHFKKLFKHYFKNPALVEMEDLFKNAKNIKNKNVLDLGCGYGEDSFDLISRDNNVTGIDISDLYINFCNNYSKKNYPDKNFKFLQAINSYRQEYCYKLLFLFQVVSSLQYLKSFFYSHQNNSYCYG